MPRVSSDTTTKAASRKASTKTKKGDGEPKAKRAPSVYNLFMAKQIKIWKEENPGKPIKEGMVAVGELWRESPENPRRGQPRAEPKAKKVKGDKENTKKPRGKKIKPAEKDEEEVSGGEDDEE